MISIHMNHLLAGFLLTASLASASIFATNCTLPTETTTIVSGANIRGTFDILWSGLFTIFICIWTVQHLNVPEQRKGRDPGWRGDLKWAWKGFFTKFKWMLFTVILPEFLFAKAYAERIVAHESMKDVRDMKAEAQISEAESSNWTTAHAFYAEMGGFVIHPHGEGTTNTRVVDTEDIMKFRRRGFLRTLPTITADHLNDLSNGDSFTKIAAVGQVSWLVVQVILRAVKRMPITQLEVTACGFAALTFPTYLLWWEKPQAVRSITELPLSETAPGFEALVKFLGVRGFSINEMVVSFSGDDTFRGLEDNEPMPQQTISRHEYIFHSFLLGFLLGGIILGCVESSAWKFDFPTRIELLLWRISSLVIIAAFPLLYTFVKILYLTFSVKRMDNSYERVVQVASNISFTIFVFVRLFILFETVYSLFHLPPVAFISTWSSNIPHLV